MNFVIVPFKNFVDAKSRLRKDISDKQTRKIVKIMLEHVLAEIKKCSDSFEKYLVTKDEEAIKIAQSQGIKTLIEKKLPLPAYDHCLKASHIFNLLDSRGVISVAERTGYINRIRDLAKGSGSVWLEDQEK